LRKLAATLGLGAFLAVSPGAAGAQGATDTRALEKDIQELKDGQARIQKQLEELSALVRSLQAGRQVPGPSEPAPPGMVVDIAGAPFKGRPDALIVLVDFNDFQ